MKFVGRAYEWKELDREYQKGKFSLAVLYGLQGHKRTVYISLLTSGKLNSYLADIDEQAKGMMFRLVEQMADKEGVTEHPKAENQMLWIRKMNEIQARAREIVQTELIFV